MSYAPIDDRFDDHPKYSEITLAEFGLIACAITYANRNLTDGRIPKGWPTRRFGRDGVRTAQGLVGKGIWLLLGDGNYEIIGFLDHNLSKAEVLSKRAKRAEAGRLGGVRSAASRGAAHGQTYAPANAEASARPNGQANGQANASAGTQANAQAVAQVLAEPRLRLTSDSDSDSDLLPSQAPAPKRCRAKPSGDHAELIAHYVAEFERIKGAKPVIGGKGGSGAKEILKGRTLDEAKLIVDRALADPWMLANAPDLASIAGKINAYIGKEAPSGVFRKSGTLPLQPAPKQWAGDGK